MPGWRGAPRPARRAAGSQQVPASRERLRQRRASARALPADQFDLLHAIPASILPARRQPGHGDDIAGLREGVIASAQRIRRAAWQTTSRPASSPAITITSLRQMPSASTITSHHCELLLRAAADRAAVLHQTPRPATT
ncbi:MAG: hypothetical protein ACLP52_10330 [Streptosporangiaceae bacterium]